MQVPSLGQEVPLEKKMATHSSILAWRIPWTEEPGGLQPMGLQRVGQDLSTKHKKNKRRQWVLPPTNQGQLGQRETARQKEAMAIGCVTELRSSAQIPGLFRSSSSVSILASGRPIPITILVDCGLIQDPFPVNPPFICDILSWFSSSHS